MSEILGTIADGLAERACTHINARDRLDALNEGVDGPTYRERLETDAAALDAMVASGLGEVLIALADPENRAVLRALQAGEPSTPPLALTTTGLVVASWDGTSFRVSELGAAALQLFDSLTEGAAQHIRARLGIRDER